MIIKQGADKNYAFFIYDAGNNIVYDRPSDIQFTVACPNNPDRAVLIKKLDNGISFDAETGKYSMAINLEDTIDLPPAEYPFDIKVKRGDKQFFVVLSGKMEIRQSYTKEI